MEERKMEDLMIDYTEGNLKGELKEHVERTIEKSEKWKAEYERLKKVLNLMDSTEELQPDESLRSDFNQMLEKEISEMEGGARVVKMETSNRQWFMRIAASLIFVILTATIVILINQNQQNQREMMALRNEMEQTKRLVISSLQNQNSASSRLNGVNTSMVMQSSDDEIITALVNTMNTDDNTNVRLAAVSALARFSEEAQVRRALLEALETQNDPVVMINLINLMVKLKEEGAIQPLKNLIEKQETHEAVKDEARLGLFKLS
ncbi:MAG: HEAT repeat domain-containing protein [Cyclobacteriaceae bacterium]